MKVTIVGAGYVGLTTGASLAYVGHDVLCVDKNPEIVERLQAGRPSIHEPGLEELLTETRGRFTIREKLPPLDGDPLVIIAVGTPPKHNGEPDLTYVESAAHEIAERIHDNAHVTVVNKSTVPIGSARHVHSILTRALQERDVTAEIHVASNPEFLAEGTALRDNLYPDRIVIGADTKEAIATLRELYAPILEQTFEPPRGTPRPERTTLPALITTTPTSAELTKYAANAFLATKISFINEFAGLAERVGADIIEVARAIGLDNRIGPRYLQAGAGWGGSCFGKDTSAITATATTYNYSMPIVQAAIDVNQRQRHHIVEKLQHHLKVLRGATIGILGIAFKGNTDDIRDAPALTIVERLLDLGASIRIHDPIALPNLQRARPDLGVTYCHHETCLAQDCDALVIVTDWDQYRYLDLDDLVNRMRGKLLLDARNLLDPNTAQRAGLNYVGIGR